MKHLLLTVAFLSAFLFSSCSAEEDEPHFDYNSYWTYIDETEQEGISTLYYALGLDDDRSYEGWTECLKSRFFHSPDSTYNITQFKGLKFGYDSISNRFVVKEINLTIYKPSAYLPDIFDKFKHIVGVEIELGERARIDLSSAPTLCDLPLKKLRVSPGWAGTAVYINGTFPKNFGNLAETLEILDIGNSQYGNEFLDLILEKFKNLKVCYLYSNNFTGEVPENLDKFSDKLEKCDLSLNHFTGKVPYLKNWQKTYYSFYRNHFTEFDWRYLDSFRNFSYCYNQKIYPPNFKENNISGKFPEYFNQEFFDYYREDSWGVKLYLTDFLWGNPIFDKEYKELEYKYHRPIYPE